MAVYTYILIGQTPVPEPDLDKWTAAHESDRGVVGQTQIGASLVSTVFLGLDHRHWGPGPPLLFETVIFTDGEPEDHIERCATWLEAERQHAEAVARVTERNLRR